MVKACDVDIISVRDEQGAMLSINLTEHPLGEQDNQELDEKWYQLLYTKFHTSKVTLSI